MPQTTTPLANRPLRWLFLLYLMIPGIGLGAEILLPLEDDVEVSIEDYGSATAKRLLIWLPSDYGLSPRQQPTARALVDLGFRVWQVDLHSAWFIPPGRNSLKTLSPEVVVALIARARAEGHSAIYVMAAGRVSALALQGVHRWQTRFGATPQLAGAILLHPQLYARTPQGGEAAQYWPVVRATNLPLYILQPELASGYWRMGDLKAQLESGGAPVYLQRVAGVSDGFNLRPDATETELRVTGSLPLWLNRAADFLDGHQGAPEVVKQPLTQVATGKDTASELLRPYHGQGPLPALPRKRLNGQGVPSLGAGRVALVNFWATWCPPCVEEIPSLNRLKRRFNGKGVEILAVNVGESSAQIEAFLREMRVDFPILLDPDGAAVRSWKVYAFPTTFVIDTQGVIRYAVFGGFDWDSAEVVEKIQALLAES